MGNYRVFATCNIGVEALQGLRRRGYELEVYEGVGAPPRSLLLQRIRSGVDGLISTILDQVDEEVFRQGAGTLKVVAQFAVGFDNIDREAANRYKIPFTYTPDVLTDATAEFALFLLGTVSRKLYSSERLVREKQWETWHPFRPFLGDEVSGKTIAVIGTGRIGQAFITKCSGFPVDILCHDPDPDDAFIQSVGRLFDLKYSLGLSRKRSSIRYVSWPEVLADADFVSIHVSLTDKTRHLFDEDAFRRMKQTAYLINTSRGPVVDEKALYRALKENWIEGAALDVYQREPLPDDSPLRDPDLLDRVRLFHHFASATKETRLSRDPDRGMAGRCVQGLIDVLERNYDGNPRQMPFVVNKEAF